MAAILEHLGRVAHSMLRQRTTVCSKHTGSSHLLLSLSEPNDVHFKFLNHFRFVQNLGRNPTPLLLLVETCKMFKSFVTESEIEDGKKQKQEGAYSNVICLQLCLISTPFINCQGWAHYCCMHLPWVCWLLLPFQFSRNCCCIRTHTMCTNPVYPRMDTP